MSVKPWRPVEIGDEARMTDEQWAKTIHGGGEKTDEQWAKTIHGGGEMDDGDETGWRSALMMAGVHFAMGPRPKGGCRF